MRCFTVGYRLLVEGFYKFFSEEEKIALLSDYEKGLSVKQLEVKYGWDRTNIDRLLDSFGVERHSARVKRELLKTFENDHEVSGVDVRAFCALADISYVTAAKVLEKAGKVIVLKQKMSQETRDKAVDLFKDGVRVKDISRSLNIPTSNVRKVLEQAGLLKSVRNVTPHVQRILDYVEACYNLPVYKTTAEMASDLNVSEKGLGAALNRCKVVKPDFTSILLRWLELNVDPGTGFIKPIHHRTLSGLLNISASMLRKVISSHPHWSLVYENGVIRDTRDVSDTSFLYQDDDWDFESDQESFDDFGNDEDFVEPAPLPPPVPLRRSEPKQPRFSDGLRRSKKLEG